MKTTVIGTWAVVLLAAAELTAGIIYDLTDVSATNPAEFSCLNYNCRFRFPEGSVFSSTNPVSFCDNYIMWAPRWYFASAFSMEFCNGTACTANCDDECACTMGQNGVPCPTTNEDANITSMTRSAPLLPEGTCDADELQAPLDAQYSAEYCPNFVTNEFVACRCVSYYCNGNPWRNLHDECGTATSTPPVPCDGIVSQCVPSDQLCPLGPTPEPSASPTGPPSPTPSALPTGPPSPTPSAFPTTSSMPTGFTSAPTLFPTLVNDCRTQDITDTSTCLAACNSEGFLGDDFTSSFFTENGVSTCSCDMVVICGPGFMPFTAPPSAAPHDPPGLLAGLRTLLATVFLAMM